VNRDREIANPPRPAQTRPIAADEALSTRVDLASAGGPHASPARRPASDSLTSIADFRSIFRLGRTAACELTRQPGFPDPVMVSARCHRWRASGVDAFDVGRRRDRDEPIASTAACSGLRWEERAALADSGRRTPAPRDPPLMRKALRARPSRPAEHEADVITSRECLPRDGPGARRPVPCRRHRIRALSSARVARHRLERAVGEIKCGYLDQHCTLGSVRGLGTLPIALSGWSGLRSGRPRRPTRPWRANRYRARAYRAVAWRAILARMARRCCTGTKAVRRLYADNLSAAPGNLRHLADPAAQAVK